MKNDNICIKKTFSFGNRISPILNGKGAEKFNEESSDEKNRICIDTYINMIFTNPDWGGKFNIHRVELQFEDDKIVAFKVSEFGAIADVTSTFDFDNGKLEVTVNNFYTNNEKMNSGIKFIDSFGEEINYIIKLFECSMKDYGKTELFNKFLEDDQEKYETVVGIKCYKICESCDEIQRLYKNNNSKYTKKIDDICNAINSLIEEIINKRNNIKFNSVEEMLDFFQRLKQYYNDFLVATDEIKIKKLNNEILKCFDDFSISYESMNEDKKENLVLKYFFNALHRNKLSVVIGSEAVMMKRIYKNALETYPRFARMSQEEQNDLLYQAYLNGRFSDANIRDIYFYAMHVFYVFYKNNITEEVVTYDDNTQKVCHYKKIYEINQSLFSIRGKYYKMPLYITYEYTSYKFKKTFYSQDLWKLLTVTSYS